jgi:hypothetical protein
MTEKFRIRSKIADPSLSGAFKRDITKERVEAIVDGNVTYDFVPAYADIKQGDAIVYSKPGSSIPLYRAFVGRTKLCDSLFSPGVRSAVAEFGEKLTGVRNSFGDADDPGTPVIVYEIINFGPAPMPGVPAVPHPDPQYDAIELLGNAGTRYIASVHATDIVGARESIKKKNDMDALRDLPAHHTTFCMSELTPEGYRCIYSFTFNSAPVVAVASPDELDARPNTITSANGIAMPWKDSQVVITKGAEAVRIMISFFAGHVFVVYERQLEIFRLETVKGKLALPLVICSIAITECILEAILELMQEPRDTVIVGIAAPETGATTPNEKAFWFLIESSRPYKSIEDTTGEDMSLPTLADATAHMRASWRNFIHVRYADGTQVVIMARRLFEARIIAPLPLSHVVLSECYTNGNQYLLFSMRKCAEAIVQHSMRAAIFGDNPFTVPLFFDQECKMNYKELLAFFEATFSERRVNTSAPVLVMNPDNLRLIESKQHALVQMGGGKFANVWQAVQSATSSELPTIGTQIYELIMARFIRIAISALYVVYNTCQSPHQHYAHVLHRQVKITMANRARIHYLINDCFERICAAEGSFPQSPAMVKVWNRTKQSGGEAQKQMFMAMVLNRAEEQFWNVAGILDKIYGSMI